MNQQFGRVTVEDFVARHPLLLSAAALAISAGIEILQGWPEFMPMGHELGEVVRNLGYGIAAAFIFNWIMVEIPRRREERRILDSYWWMLNELALCAGYLIAQYRAMAPEGEYNTQTKNGMKEFLQKIDIIDSKEPGSIPGDPTRYAASDPFAETTLIDHVEQLGRELSPFLHRLEPRVADSVTELVRFRDRMNGLRPIYMERGTLDKELFRIWEFVRLCRCVRLALLEHYPKRELRTPTIIPLTPTRQVVQIVEADL